MRHGESDCWIEFSLLVVDGDIDGFFDAINNPDPLESRSVVKARWFRYRGIRDVYKYLINGSIYSISVTDRKICKSQQPAFVLYNYLDFLCSESIDMINKICARDFDRLGYTKL